MMTNAFATDIAHHEYGLIWEVMCSSRHRQNYNSGDSSDTMMGRYCTSFMDALLYVYGTNFTTPLCDLE